MTASLLDGNAFLASMKDDLAARVRVLGKHGITPGLGTILVGNDPNSASYVRRKHTNCDDIGMASIHEELPDTATQDDVMAAVDRFNANPEVDAFIVQLPLPRGIDEVHTLHLTECVGVEHLVPTRAEEPELPLGEARQVKRGRSVACGRSNPLRSEERLRVVSWHVSDGAHRCLDSNSR